MGRPSCGVEVAQDEDTDADASMPPCFGRGPSAQDVSVSQKVGAKTDSLAVHNLTPGMTQPQGLCSASRSYAQARLQFTCIRALLLTSFALLVEQY
jgi:hypothetical protein